jgi:hypothetical protein
MKTNLININGNQEDLVLFNETGKRVFYRFQKDETGLFMESTYDVNGNLLTFKNSNGYSWERNDDLVNIYKY